MDWLRRWKAGRQPAQGDRPARWVMVDVESSGLDPARDRLLAIAAVALRADWAAGRLALEPGDSFEAILRQAVPSPEANILVHGIGAGRQAGGVDTDAAMREFEAYVADAPLLAFHAGFDARLLARHAPGGRFGSRWVDVERLCAAVMPDARARSLDEWLQVLGIACLARHDAAADALAQGEILLRIWPLVAPQCRGWSDVERMARSGRWLGGG